MNKFETDKWGITDILRICDRRLGKRRLRDLKNNTTNEKLINIIDKRLSHNKNEELRGNLK